VSGRPFTVLVSSAGRRVELLRGFRDALAAAGLAGRVLAADRSWYSSAFHEADEGVLVPACDDDAFVPAVLELCDKHAVELVVPTIDPELPVYAAARERFAAAGVTVAVSGPETVAIAADKVLTHAWLVEHGLPTVRQAAVDVIRADPPGWPFPLVVKPRFGSAGIGVAIVSDPDELDTAARGGEMLLARGGEMLLARGGEMLLARGGEMLLARGGEMVVQEVAPGREHTIDVLVDASGRCVSAVPRQRLEVRAGEVSKAVTVRSPALEDLAARVGAALPGAYGPLTVQVFAADDGGLAVIEVNARFGGGFPLAREAGADHPRWLIEEVAGLPSTADAGAWRAGLVMLRYDAAVFVDEGEREG
jgi:carbamoyl-phosphate synthase large subunit